MLVLLARMSKMCLRYVIPEELAPMLGEEPVGKGRATAETARLRGSH
jgi:hypothetical protein